MNKKTALSSAIFTALFSITGTNLVLAQSQVDDSVLEEVMVNGVRASLERSMDVKRNSNGIVDAISAEDMGQFPDVNLAESLQRITGVSINKVNGEGSEVTVRGFGGQYNLVTLNGRQMPAANVTTVGGDQSSDFAIGQSRSFDFSNIAPEGVSLLEVIKTGKAHISSGGIGATINVETYRPLDNPGFYGILTAKAVHDESVAFRGDEWTPEVSGVVSWANEDKTFGVSLVASYKKRNSASVSATVNGWNINTQDFFLDPNQGRVRTTTSVTGASGDPEQLVSYPNDSRYHLAEAERKLANGILAVQWAPTDNLVLSFDAFVARNAMEEHRSDQTNWFNRPFNEVVFDGHTAVSTTVFLQENIAGVKDTGFEQQLRATKDELDSYGFNADWNFRDDMSLMVDLATSTGQVIPDGPLGNNSVLVSMGAPVISAHSLDFRNSEYFPRQSITVDDSQRGNNSGGLDVGDLGSQVARTITSGQKHEIDQARLDFNWNVTDSARLTSGVDYRKSTMQQDRLQTQQTLGDWGISNPGDVPADLIDQFCLTCMFDDYNTGATGDGLIAFKGNAADLYTSLSNTYAGLGNPVQVTADEFNQVDEDILAGYVQFNLETEVADHPLSVVVGLRYETTDVHSTSIITIPENIVWQSDNDFNIVASSTQVPASDKASYDNLLPNLDLALNVTDDMKVRFSYSKTIARPSYGNLFFQDDANSPPRPTALGGIASGTRGNPGLLPLESDNIDVSWEWYYGDASYVSVGFYDKRVKNFIGVGQSTTPLFDLRDPSSGLAGTRSGDALDALASLGQANSDVNMFTMTALIDNSANVADAMAIYNANLDAQGNLNQAFVDSTFAAYNIIANADDPLFQFEVTGPVNQESAEIYGFEVALQHFFGDSGFGIQANFTTVDGDVEFDNGADPSVDQFALLGLSDTANVVLIYDNHGFATRLAYNWRDSFLSNSNRGGGNRNPVYVEEFGQLDWYASYAFNDHWQVQLEGINLTSENHVTYGRDRSNVWYIQQLDTRYGIGLTYKF